MANYPISDDPIIQKVAKVVQGYLGKEGYEFLAQGTALFPQEVGGHFGFLPALMCEAKKKYESIFMKEFPVSFMQAEKTVLGVVPVCKETSFPQLSVLCLFTQYCAEEYVQKYKNDPSLLVDGKIPLDSMIETWIKSIEENQIQITMPSTSPSASAM